jgi:hypothetical protein
MMPIAAAANITRIKEVMRVEPALLFVACTKISMKGKLVGLFNALVISPRQKSSAICFSLTA